MKIYQLAWTFGDVKISQLFGENPSMYKPYGLDGHEGIDIALNTGTKLYSPIHAIQTSYTEFLHLVYGKYVCLADFVQGVRLYLCHMMDTDYSYGEDVFKGSCVGHSGNTGRSTGPHTHLMLIPWEDDKILYPYNGYHGCIDPFGPNVKWSGLPASLKPLSKYYLIGPNVKWSGLPASLMPLSKYYLNGGA